VGLGSEQGAFVPVEKSREAPEGFLLGLDGKAVISSRQSDSLRSGAEKTGGHYIDGSRKDAAKILAGHINTMTFESRFSGRRWEANPRWRIFIFAALSCLGGTRIMGFSRRRSKKKTLSVLLCLILFSSCAKTQGKLLIMEANFLYSRGFYTEAILSYMKALKYEDAAPYAEYGLASVFFVMDESDASLERYKEAELSLERRQEDHPELRYRIHYNRGIIYFEKGDYGEATKAFREALKVDGSRIDAKRNLELSLLTGTRSNKGPPAFSRGDAENSLENSGSAVLFEYIREKEQEQWKSREWMVESDPFGLDY
jgi:Ca-activated chloride channel family protein